MFRTLLLVVLVVCFMVQNGMTGTVKRKRQAGSMLGDYLYGSGEDYHYPEVLPTTLYFYVIYDKKFNMDLLSTESMAFRREAKRVARSMANQIARNIGLIPQDVTVEVISFTAGSTKAEIAVGVPGDYQITEEELSKAVTDVASDGGSVAGRDIVSVNEIKDNMADGLAYEGTETVIIDLELTYEFDSSDKSVDLADRESDDFMKEALSIQEQLTLHIVDKLAAQGAFVSPDQLTIDILNFESTGTNTKVVLTVEAESVGVDELSDALNYLVIDDDVNINENIIVSIEELSRSVSYMPNYDDGEMPTMDMEVMPHDVDHGPTNLNGEPVPPDDSDYPTIEAEVMTPKDELNGDDTINGNDYDPGRLPDDFYDTYDGGPIIPELEPVPADDNTTANVGERVPPDDFPRYCSSIIAPERGVMECLNENAIGSICLFTCDEDTRMEGEESIICDAEGAWSNDAPYCVRIYCQPHHITHENGVVECTDANNFQSVCMFTCNDRHTLVGEKSVICQKDESWSAPAPVCEPDPINCEEEYGEWSECENGKRIKESVMISSSSRSVVCPEIVEKCVDCALDWGPWGECQDDLRSRAQYVAQERVGAGKDCPEPRVAEQQCFDCVIEWGDWSQCSEGTRSRTQFVKVTPVGGSECPPRETETQDCIDCTTGWTEWSECENGEAARAQYILQEAENGGKDCPPLELQKERCTNCAYGWGEWSECRNNLSTRHEIVTVQPKGRGSLCPDLLSEEMECSDCEVEWSEWSECSGGYRSRQLEISTPAVGTGTPCPDLLDEEKEECVHCEIEWGDWGECIEGERHRFEIVVVDAKGSGNPCREQKIETKVCANCEVSWGEWSECVGGERERTQYVSQQPFGVDKACPTLQTEGETCADCVWSWGEWGECLNGLQERSIIIEEDPVGAGKACPTENLQVKECCFYEWGEWSECEGGERSRIEQIVVQPSGETCPPGKEETESCVDCLVEWADWSEKCVDNTVIRYQFVKQQSEGAGEACPELQSETALCSNCEVEWEEWSECTDNYRERSQFIVVEQVGVGTPCPDLEFESQDCANCEIEWTEWSECAGGKRRRTQSIIVSGFGGGTECPDLQVEEEDCVDCVVDWEEWSACENNIRIREMYIKVKPVGYGAECPPLDGQQEACANCEVEWSEWSECVNDLRIRDQTVVVIPYGGGESCPALQREEEACIDCVVDWGEWTECFSDQRTRRQEVIVPLVGAGKECPPLEIETEECVVHGSKKALEKTICRFTDVVLGYKRNPQMRDLLLVGDESGSIGWVNFGKIKDNFKGIARNIKGGIGTQETQLAMTSFARFSRTLFDFDDFDNAIDVVDAIDRAYFLGGYRSRIGGALSDANQWLFQQTGGMRSFPNIDDNIVHEILIATDGCRTSDKYLLDQGIKLIKKRGIKLYVLGIETKDKRCVETIESMVEDKNDLFLVGGWDQLDEMNKRIEEKVCITTTSEIDEEEKEDFIEDHRGDGGTSSGGSGYEYETGEEKEDDDYINDEAAPSPLDDGSHRGDGV